ncbi:aspartate kinase [Alteribacillus bidgolensis]|uniref:Aspartokinase n=1 Tax=Alteribacillus bidgolensis TaxID=930129 RepID=A0A1G8D6Q7_9BACI|nr:aspartate kinase [Alteribacillus bidgolensis]SDH53392.1 aspartate kinase [Alteribacillus bidgolensis]
MGIVVQKYGGTSVGDVSKIKKVAERVKQTVEEGDKVIVVVSAMGDQTDKLVSLMYEVTDTPPRREMDMILTTGEQVSIALLSASLQEMNVPSISYTGWQAGIATEPYFGNARIINIESERIQESIDEGKVVIVAGFQGMTNEKEIATLGRGGSDTTAVAVTAALKADRCEINTDVDGIYSTDPRIVPYAKKLSTISFDEMLEMAVLGASVLHPRAVELAKVHGVNLLVRSSFSDKEGTYVKEENTLEKEIVVSGVAYDEDVSKIEVLDIRNEIGAMSKVFDSLAQANINVDMIVLSEHGAETFHLAFTVGKEEAERAMEIIEKQKENLSFRHAFFEKDVAKVSIIGAGMITNTGVAAKMFNVLNDNDIRMKMITTSEIKVSCLVPLEYGKQSVKILHSAYDLDTENETKIEA